MWIAKTLIRLGGCPGWSESSLNAQPFFFFCHIAAHFYEAVFPGLFTRIYVIIYEYFISILHVNIWMLYCFMFEDHILDKYVISFKWRLEYYNHQKYEHRAIFRKVCNITTSIQSHKGSFTFFGQNSLLCTFQCLLMIPIYDVNLKPDSGILRSKSHICWNSNYQSTYLSSATTAHLLMKECPFNFTWQQGVKCLCCMSGNALYSTSCVQNKLCIPVK